jgi:hypothetical protein
MLMGKEPPYEDMNDTGLRPLFPFDNKNKSDFNENTKKIKNALSMIKSNPEMKPTAINLANEAGVYIRTLYTPKRRYVLRELKVIQEQRKIDKEISARKKRQNKEKAQSDSEREKVLEEELIRMFYKEIETKENHEKEIDDLNIQFQSGNLDYSNNNRSKGNNLPENETGKKIVLISDFKRKRQ